MFHAWGWTPGGQTGAGSDGGSDPTIRVTMPGGDATVELAGDGEAVLSGPVHHVATLEIPDA